MKLFLRFIHDLNIYYFFCFRFHVPRPNCNRATAQASRDDVNGVKRGMVDDGELIGIGREDNIVNGILVDGVVYDNLFLYEF